MSLKEIFLGGGGLLVVLLTLVEFAPIKINPWSALARAIGRAVNADVLRDIPHTKEEFIDVLADIDFYERYCRDHENYKNNRAVHAIANISRVYDDRLREHDFLKSSSNERDEDAPET